MRPAVGLVVAALFFTCVAAPLIAAGAALRGRVVDESEGVLPGVTVEARSADGKLLAAAVTDGTGEYVFATLPEGSLTLSFTLEGFDSQRVALTLRPDVETVVPIQRLGLAPLTDSVLVVGKAPVIQAAPPLPAIPHVLIIPVPEHDQESVCGPAKAGSSASALGTILGPRYGTNRGLFAQGDELTIRGGRDSGLLVGQNLAVRRVYRPDGANRGATGEHTAGLLQIVAVDDQYSTGVVVYACDEMMAGDFLAAVTPEPVRDPDPIGLPVFEQAARILFADDKQMLGMPRRLMVIDRGATRGVRPGQRLTLFHKERGTSPLVIGDAVVVAVRPDSATIRIERAMDAVRFGDYAAPQRQLSARQSELP